MATHNIDLQLYEATFNDQEFSSSNNLTRALQTQSEWLSPLVTNAFGSSAMYGKRNFPLSFATEGRNQMKRVSTTDLSYKWPVLGKPKKTSNIARQLYASTDRPGRGHTKFKAVFADRWFYRSQTVYSPSRLECRVQSDPIQKTDGWEYEMVLISRSKTAYVPVSDFDFGKSWGQGLAKVGKERSQGVEHRSYNPFVLNNQLSVVRDSYKLAGNIKNKVMVIEIRVDGQTFKLWTQWEMYQRQLQWKEKCETDLWYSIYNKDADGVVHTIDEDSGEVVPSGAGLLEQIPNEDSYSILTTKKLESVVTDVFYNATDSDAVNVEIYTGTGGFREASKAMELASRSFQLVDSHFVNDSSQSFGMDKRTGMSHNKFLMFGAYFNLYRHIDGHTVTFKMLPMMDRGVFADIQGSHPIEGLPIESYNMYIVDNSTYDGMNNLQYVTETGREDVNFIVAGAASIPGQEDPLFRSSSVDASTIEWIKSQGIAMMRPTNTLKLFNVAQ